MRKYLDFLVSKSKAKVLTSGTLNVWNKAVGHDRERDPFPRHRDGETQIAETVNDTSEITISIPGQSEPLTLTANKPGETTVTTVKESRLRTTNNAEFGFRMELLPEVYGESTIVRVRWRTRICSDFHSDGTPRTSRTELATTLQVNNKGSVFYIGGLEKSDLVRSVSKVPVSRGYPRARVALFGGERDG